MAAARFLDRRDAGRQLASCLRTFARRADVLVLGLPRGGVPVAHEVALAIGAPLDVLVVRKLGVPGHEELALGAIASGGGMALNRPLITQLGISQDAVERVRSLELAELARRERAYRGDMAPVNVTGRTVILVDDGLATGATMSAAVTAVREGLPRRIVVAVPVASREALRELSQLADECVCVLEPEPFYGVGFWYDDFGQTSDLQVQQLLASSRRRPAIRELLT